jgi:hypothetical protein
MTNEEDTNMKRILRKVASIFVATAMVAALGVSAMAADMPQTGIEEGTPVGESVGNSITLYKGIMPYNSDNLEINAPTISYSFSIDAGEADQEIIDAAGVKVKTKAGVTGGVSIDSSTCAWTNNDTMTPGTLSTKPFTITFASDVFTSAGVYRYVITDETTADTLAAAGVTRDTNNYDGTRYLDVYVKEDSGSFVIYGYVCFTTQVNPLNDTEGKAAENAVKTQGFVNKGGESGTGTDTTCDAYYTYNVTVGKELVNDTEHNGNKFPFTVKFKNETITGNIKLTSDVTGTADLKAELASASINGLESTANIAHGGTVKYIGIPCGTEVEVFETNNVSTAAYTSECSGADEAVDSKVISLNEASNTASVKCDKNVAGTSKTVTFTNTLALISPTGVALAVLPFVILLGFGVGFMVVSTTKRKEELA